MSCNYNLFYQYFIYRSQEIRHVDRLAGKHAQEDQGKWVSEKYQVWKNGYKFPGNTVQNADINFKILAVWKHQTLCRQDVWCQKTFLFHIPFGVLYILYNSSPNKAISSYNLRWSLRLMPEKSLKARPHTKSTSLKF